MVKRRENWWSRSGLEQRFANWSQTEKGAIRSQKRKEVRIDKAILPNSNDWDGVEKNLVNERAVNALFSGNVLTKKEKNLLRWRYLEDLTCEQIAERLNLRVSTVKTKITNTKKKLRESEFIGYLRSLTE